MIPRRHAPFTFYENLSMPLCFQRQEKKSTLSRQIFALDRIPRLRRHFNVDETPPSARSRWYFKSSRSKGNDIHGVLRCFADAQSLRDIRNNGGDVVGRRATFARVYLTNKPRCVYRARELPTSLVVRHIARTYSPATMPRAIRRGGGRFLTLRGTLLRFFFIFVETEEN